MPLTHLNKSFKTLRSFAIIIIAVIFSAAKSYSQATCPLNIDFELGGFQNWQCYSGTTSSSGNTNLINVSLTSPISGIHQVLKSSSAVDRYVPIKLAAPDGSDYIVKLGNDGTGSRAERISYTFTVPNNQADFVVTYQYAVVLEDPGHPAAQQPRFTAKVFDITTNSYIDCGSFDYVATANLPGFKKLSGIVYKDWTPASINLYGYQGHQLRLEFSTADCTQSGHFGYAYVDVNKTCSSLITGNNFCPEQPTFKLTGPAGFDKYNWFNADRSKLLGTGQVLELPTANNDNKTIVLDLIPFVGFGCNYTTSVVTKANPPVTLTVKDPTAVCFPSTVDITTAGVITNKTAGLSYTFWKDAAATQAVTKPDAIAVSGTYYIKAASAAGCYVVSPVKVAIVPLPTLTVVNPPSVCVTSSVDLTAPAVTTGSSTGLTFTYWADLNATQALQTPSQIKTAGTYYIKGTNANGCFVIKPVTVSFYALPILKISNPAPVCFPSTIDIRSAQITSGSDPNLTFTYWLDAGCTQPLPAPDKVGVSGQYFIKATNVHGCETVKPVDITINPLPELKVTNPAAVCYPLTIDITNSSVITNKTANITYSYWTDAAATVALNKPDAIGASGTYYIKATSSSGCYVVNPVNVIINPLPVINIVNPATVCLLSSVDITTTGITAGSASGLTYTYWTDAAATRQLSNPSQITTAGTYYIKGTNANGCSTIKPVSVTFYDLPVLNISNPAAVCFPSTVDLTRAQVTTGSDINLSFSYWLNAACTQPLSSPDKVGVSGQYFIKAINKNGCEMVKPVVVTVNPLPELKVTEPAAVCYPETIDITKGNVTGGSTNVDKLTYWLDAAATKPLSKPTAVADSGLYYIKATSIYGCEIIKPVLVTIHALPVLTVADPKKVYTPNTVDLTDASVTKGSMGVAKFTYWRDAAATDPVSTPKKVTQTGTYYIKGENKYGCFVIKPVEVLVSNIPDIQVPKAFTPMQTQNNRLYPFLVSVKELTSFKVYNRWGVLVFQTNNPSPTSGWDGVYKSQVQFLDVFTWYAEGIDYVGNIVRRSGNTVLLK
ncbi:gliding motility-associated C-terminal domain-containing protein [Mucilaginibacter auburnensis]|uniref:CHU domain-containing protein n=1 Tax=Mucilaginibacter auburnensis TaxID=1457233 RepID=A0A2H9VLG2_9SPHI|nr:gliding motility-associated C-terminal domain-containing protein [Mucilaginibacter auburnensis]PJJ79152.1 CHU domain-containing protein [Mucilaginibacter auburnensis]